MTTPQGTGAGTNGVLTQQKRPPVSELSNEDAGPQMVDAGLMNMLMGRNPQTPDEMIMSQNFTPQPSLSPTGSIVNSFMDQQKYGMNDRAQAEHARMAALGGPEWNNMSLSDQVRAARAPQMNEQLPHAFIGSPTTDAQRAAVANGTVSPTGGMVSQGATGNNPLVPLGGAAIPEGNVQGGQFKPVTFRSGTGTATLTPEGITTELAEPYANLSNLVGEGQGLMGQAATQAQQAPDQFNYGFDPSGRAQELMAQRSALLEPAFAQQRSAMNEGMFGSGRLGLRLAGEGQGAGDGTVQPDAFGMNQAQSQALAQLAAQSSTDAFGESMQRAGLDLSQFGANQGTKQQQYANLAGMGSGMLSAGLQAPALEQSLYGAPLAAEGLRQNYELGMEKNDISRMLAQAQANQANYQPNPWLSGLTSMGTSFLGTNTGSNWLNNLFT